MVKYSFVLPAYKARFFKKAIDSILNQTYKEFELIIVNDASPEDLDIIVNSYDDYRIRYYVNEQNIGGKNLVAQWNHCLEYAKGEYVILASDDDIYSPFYLDKMDELVCKYPEVNVFRPRVMFIDGNGELCSYASTEGFLKEKVNSLEFVHSLVYDRIGSGIPFYIFKKSSLNQIGGFIDFPLAWFSDDATVIKLSDKGIVYSSEILFYFRMSGENITTKQNAKITLLKKMEATQHFYNFLRFHLNSLKNITKEEQVLLTDVNKAFLSYFFCNKIVNQIFNSSCSVAISVFPTVWKMDFVPKIKLIERYIKYLTRKFCCFL